MSVILNNKPLVESIFELRWALQERGKNIKVDPHYKLLIGRLYDRVCHIYPYHEQLQTAEMPDEIAHYIVQHRFRTDKNKWPLVQLGPGIITVNDTENYIWSDFEKHVNNTVENLFEAYPSHDGKLEVNNLLLRYIDALPFDFEKEDIFQFLKKMMHTNIELHPKLFKDTPVKASPINCNLLFSFKLEKPKAIIHLRFARGKQKETDSLFWETMVQSTQDDTPKDLDKIAEWVKFTHDITDDWFFKLIEGELFERFK